MDKVKLNIKDGKAIITEGGDTALGKILLTHKGKLRLHIGRKKGELELAK